MCVCVWVGDIVVLLQSECPGASKAEGLDCFHPLIIMIEKRVTAPENWPESPISCCGQRAAHYPQCIAPWFHQKHNTMLTPGLCWIGLTFFIFLSSSSANSEFNECITHVWSKLESKALLSFRVFKYISGKFLTCFCPLTLLGHFHFPLSGKWGISLKLIKCVFSVKK